MQKMDPYSIFSCHFGSLKMFCQVTLVTFGAGLHMLEIFFSACNHSLSM